MANVLIVYATKEGQTAKIARHIAQTLSAVGHKTELFDADHPTPRLDVRRFQFAMVGGPIHAGGYPHSLARFVRKNRAFLGRVRSAFFSVGLAIGSHRSDGRAQTLPLVDKFLRGSGWQPQRIELIAGALPYSKYNPLVRLVMRHIAEKEGGDTDTSRDYEYTDFAAVERFAREFVAPLAPSSLERPAPPALE